MPIALRPVADSKFYVSIAVPATITAGGYAALTWTEVKGFDSIPAFGLMRDVGTFDSLTDGRLKYRNIKDVPNFDGTMADLPTDPGQIILKAAFAAAQGTTAESVSMRSEDASGLGTYARGMVAKWARQGGGAAALWLRSTTLIFDPSTIIEY